MPAKSNKKNNILGILKSNVFSDYDSQAEISYMQLYYTYLGKGNSENLCWY